MPHLAKQLTVRKKNKKMSASFPESGHANLSALQVIGSSVVSLLGPVKGVKCVFDEDSSEGLLVTSTNKLLQNLHIEHPVGQLGREFCLSQHKRHGSSCTTLVTLAGLWAANVQFLLNQDVPIQDIIRIGDEFLQDCEDVAEQCTISIHSLPKPTTVTANRETERNRIILDDSSASHKCSKATDPIHHGDIMRSEVTEIDNFGLNQKSKDSCALPSQTILKITNPTESSGVQGKHSLTSDFKSTFSLKHAIPFLSANSAEPGTSSAISMDDVDDVSWFFENDSHYVDQPKDVTAAGKLASSAQKPTFPFLSTSSTKPDTSSAICTNFEQFSLQGHKQNDSCRGEKEKEEEDINDVEWFFKDNDCLEVTDLKETEQQRVKTKETASQALYRPLLKSGQHGDLHSGIKHRSQASSSSSSSQERSSTSLSPIQRSLQLESLLKSAIEQKPSKLLKGSRRILSRHLLEDGASDVPLSETKSKQTFSNFGQHHLKDEKTSVVPNATLGSATSVHFSHQDAVQRCSVRKQNVDVPQMLADDVMGKRDLTRKAEESDTIARLGDSLSHGADAEMKLAVETCQSQLITSQEQHRFVFRPELVHVQTLTGPPSSSSCCIHGLVLPCHEDQLNTIHTIEGKSLKGLLLNGDLQESYRHRGFKDSLKSTSTVSGVPPSATDVVSTWTNRVLSILKKLNVNLLIVRGSVDSSLVDACCFHNILVLDNVPYRLLQLLVTVHKSNLLTYIPDALQDDVCENILVSYWSSGYDPHPTVRSRDLKLQHHVRIICPGNVMTIVLCAPSEPHLTGAEQRLHTCMARLRGALHDGKVLLGGGRIEQHLVEKFTQQSGDITDFHNYHHGLVYEALAEGFASYIQNTHLNMGQLQPAAQDDSQDSTGCHSSPSSNVHDCFSAKKGAWQKAWHLVKQVLLCDALIVTGVDKEDRYLDRVL